MPRDSPSTSTVGSGREPPAIIAAPAILPLPRESLGMEFPSQITFAGESRRWGRGVAFLEHRRVSRGTPGALGRRYLITRQQFEDVFAQENGQPTSAIEFDNGAESQPYPISKGWYGALVTLEPVDGVPVFTFTSPEPPETRISNPPSVEYLRTIATGLSQVHDIDMHRIVERLRNSEVVANAWSHEDLYSSFSGI